MTNNVRYGVEWFYMGIPRRRPRQEKDSSIRLLGGRYLQRVRGLLAEFRDACVLQVSQRLPVRDAKRRFRARRAVRAPFVD